MELNIFERTADQVKAGYACPCGCRPTVAYTRHSEAAYDSCCCGNEFALGPSAHVRLTERAGFERSIERLQAPWGDALEAVWLIGPSAHPEEDVHDHAEAPSEPNHGSTHEHVREPLPVLAQEPAGDSALDPVCGMTVDRELARAKGLVSTYEDREYFFCGKGCKLDFEEDPARYFDPTYQPTM